MIIKAKLNPEKLYFLIFPALILYMEMVVKLACFGSILPTAILYTGLFSISFGLFFAFICSLWRRKVNWILTVVLLSFVLIFCSAQIVYYTIFETFGTLYSLFVGADALTEFWSSTVTGILSSIVPLIFLITPFILLLILGKRFVPEKNRTFSIKMLAGSIAFHLIALLLILNANAGIMTIRYLYKEAFIPTLSVSQFGVITTLRLDAQAFLFSDLKDKQDNSSEPEEEEEPDPEPIYEYNITDIDFNALMEGESDETVLKMHEYFSQRDPTKQNEYTGLFKGKNLIWIVGEAFSTLALNEELTPTLSRLAGEGFVFNNFYNPVWSVSTSDGEYVTLTGLIPKSGVWSFRESSRNYMPYGFGNLLTKEGYTCKAYHNHYYSYYDRHLSHPNMGYDYKGLGNGLKVTEVWPESDLEMMEITIPGDIVNTPFHTYYMTVSGHLNYTFLGNSMATRHRDKVRDLPLSEACQAYLACNIELDLAIEYLIKQLDAAGELDNTVIILSGDHYPYGLTDEEMNELAGYELEEKFEKFKSTLILWSGDMDEPVQVDKVCSSLDIMPTIANLMGLNYDSRLVMGQDILSESPGLVEFNDRSFITDLGRYDAKTNEFIQNDGVKVGDDYARNLLKQVNDMFYYSAKILEKDYYRAVLP